MQIYLKIAGAGWFSTELYSWLCRVVHNDRYLIGTCATVKCSIRDVGETDVKEYFLMARRSTMQKVSDTGGKIGNSEKFVAGSPDVDFSVKLQQRIGSLQNLAGRLRKCLQVAPCSTQLPSP